MKLYAIKFANGLYLNRVRKDFKVSLGDVTEDLNEAYVYHEPEDLIDRVEGCKDIFPGAYRALMEDGGGSYRVIEVKITEVEDDPGTEDK